MGNRSSRQHQFAYNPAMNGWEIKEKGDEFNVWRNTQTGEEIEEYRRVFSDRRHFDYQREMFEYRLDSDILVASKFFREESQRDMCSTFYKGNVYLEHIPVRLNQINEIPYPDVLHLYQQAFRGFAKLFDKVGYFEPTQNLICVNQQGRVKIWLNDNLAKSLPETVFGDVERTEANMVRNVVNTIQSNTDVSTLPENILDTMRRHSVSTFRDANNVLQDIATRYGTTIPTRLDCVLEMHPELLTRVTRDSSAVRIPAVSVIPGASIQQPMMSPVGVSPGSIFVQSALNRTLPAPITQSITPSNVHVKNINMPIQTQTIVAKPTTTINSGPRINVNQISVSAIPINNINKPLSATAPYYSARVVSQTNQQNGAAIGTVGRALPSQALPVIPETYRVSPGIHRKNMSLVEGAKSQTTFTRNIHNRKGSQPNQNIPIKPQNPTATATAINTATAKTNPSINTASQNIKTIYEVESSKSVLPVKSLTDVKLKEAEVKSSEITTSVGIKFFEERKSSKIDHTVSQPHKKKKINFTTAPVSSLAHPITNITPSIPKDFKIETNYTTIIDDKYTYDKYSSETVKESVGVVSSTPTYDYFKSLNNNLYGDTYPTVEFTLSSTYIPPSLPITSLSNPIDSIGISTTYQPYTLQLGNTLYNETTSFNTTSFADKYKSFDTEIINYHAESRTVDKDFDYNYTSSLATSKQVTGELPYSRFAMTMALEEKTSNDFGSKQMKYSYYEHDTEKTSFDYTTTNYGITTTPTVPSLTAYSNIPFSTVTTTIPISYTGLQTGKREESYNISMDNDLLRDLESMRNGSKPYAPAGDFIPTTNFGVNSEYVRDSIKTEFSY